MINSKDIAKLSGLARIELSASEKKSLKKDLMQILDYMDKLKEADIRGTSELTHATGAVNEMREDSEAEPAGAHTQLLVKAMKAVKNGFLKVKYVFK